MSPPSSAIRSISTENLYHIEQAIKDFYICKRDDRTIEEIVQQKLNDAHIILRERELKALIYVLTLRIDEINI